jgi:hypothetical protein
MGFERALTVWVSVARRTLARNCRSSESHRPQGLDRPTAGGTCPNLLDRRRGVLWDEAPCVSHFSEHGWRCPALHGRTRAPMPRIFVQPPRTMPAIPPRQAIDWVRVPSRTDERADLRREKLAERISQRGKTASRKVQSGSDRKRKGEFDGHQTASTARLAPPVRPAADRMIVSGVPIRSVWSCPASLPVERPAAPRKPRRKM